MYHAFLWRNEEIPHDSFSYDCEFLLISGKIDRMAGDGGVEANVWAGRHYFWVVMATMTSKAG